MRRIIVMREKKFASALLPYWIITNISKRDFMHQHGFDNDLCQYQRNGHAASRIEICELDRIGRRINHGEIVELLLDDSTESLFACSVDGSLSNEIIFEDDKDDPIKLALTTKGGWKTVSYPFFKTFR